MGHQDRAQPESPLFREARYLLAEETEIRDPALYHSVLGAIAAGNHTNGGIASFVGRKSAEITHPLTSWKIARSSSGKPTCSGLDERPTGHRAADHLLRGDHETEWFRLESGLAEAVWRDQRADFLSRVVGPHFETLCRNFALRADSGLFGSPAEKSAPVS